MDAIRVRGLTKRFDDLVAVDDVSFRVGSGEFFGLLGPNGAGKSTLINMLCTLLRPTEGTAEVAGHDIRADPEGVRESIGVVFQEPALDDRLTGRENLRFHAMLYGLSGSENRERVRDVLDLVDLDAKGDIEVGAYSGGMKRRLEIARGLVHRPDVLFLDEPTLGLDARTRRRTREYLEDLNAETGVTVVLTTHEMAEADRLCNRIAICDRGSVVALDSPARLKRSAGGGFVGVTVAGGRDRLASRLADEPWVERVERIDDRNERAERATDERVERGDDGGDGGANEANETDETGGTLHVGLDSAEQGNRRVPAVVAAATAVGAPVASIDVREPSLETVFLSLTGETIAERESAPTGIDSDTTDPGTVTAEPATDVDGETESRASAGNRPSGSTEGPR